MDRKTFLAISLCFLIFVVWQKVYLEPRTQQQQAWQQAQQAAAPTQAPPSALATDKKPTSAAEMKSSGPTPLGVPPQEKLLQTKTAKIIVSNGSKFFSAWELTGYRQKIEKDSATVDIRHVVNQDGELEFAFDDPALAYISQVRGALKETANGFLWSFEDANLILTREITASPDSTYVDVRIEAQFKTKPPGFAFVSLGSHSPEKDPEEQDRQLLYWGNNSIERPLIKDITEVKEVPTSVKYIAAANRYFLFATVAQSDAKALLQPTGPRTGRISLVYPTQGQGPGSKLSIPLRVYFGPKELEILRSVEPTLDHTVDFGWFTIVAYPLLKLLRWFYSFVKNYGVAIILLTLFVRLITYPLTYKSMKSMKDMARLQPQLQKIREKYADDKEALNREMLTIMRSHGYNPVAGCLPILVQMPIFFALYRVLYGSVELYQAPFAFWIQDLSAKDPLYITPVLLSLTMYLQQKLTPNTATDPMQQKMLQFMPLIFGAFMLTLPSGLTVYMLISAVAGIAQQLILNKKFGLTPVPAVIAKK